jgi:hypothetical protein
MARLKIKKTDEYEIHDIYKEFLVTVGEQEFKILKKNRTIRVLKKIDIEGEKPIYTELKGKEIGDLMKRLRPPSNLGMTLPRIPLPSPSWTTPVTPYIWVGSDSPENDISDSGFDDESTRVLYEDEYNNLLEGLDDEYGNG